MKTRLPYPKQRPGLLLALCCLTLLTSVTSLQTSAAEPAQYTCPMHPHYLSTDAEGQCPICGMDLVPVRKAFPATGPRVTVDPGIRQSIGIRTAPAAITPLAETLRAFGTVEADEDSQSVATARTEGWIESLAVRVRGARVEQGDVLYTIYSPALLAAQQDYLGALASSDRSRTRATRSRLRSLGMQPAVIEQLASERKVFDAVPVQAEASGIVEALQVRDGDYLRPGREVLRLQSYDRVWVLARIPETQLSLVSDGAPVTLSFPGAPGAPIRSMIDYIYPTLDRQTRTGEIRVLVDNPAGELRPGAYVDVRIELGRSEQLSVPQDALLYDSRGAVVMIAHDDGGFSRRPVQPGLSADGRTAILEGLEAGESVVVSGQFLLDAEARLRQGLDRFQSPADGIGAGHDQRGHAATGQPAADAMMPATALVRSTGSFAGLITDDRTLATLDHLTDMALYLHEALIDGYPARPAFLAPALAAGRELQQRFEGTVLGPVLTAGRAALEQAQQARSPAELAAALSALLAALEPWLLEGAPDHYRAAGLTLFRDAATGSLWLQEGAAPLNPYGKAAAEAQPWPTADTGRG